MSTKDNYLETQLARLVEQRAPGPLPPFKSVGKWTPSTDGVRDATGWGEAFDRWLAEVIRENRAIGWDEGERHESEHMSTYGQFCPGEHCNPYRGDTNA